MEVIGSDAGAVIYQICFPESLDCESSFEAFGSESAFNGKNPLGGTNGAPGAAIALVDGRIGRFDALLTSLEGLFTLGITPKGHMKERGRTLVL